MEGLAGAWVVAYRPYLLIGSARALPVIGVRAAELAGAIAPALLAAVVMAVAVLAVDGSLPPRLALLVVAGATTYGGWLLLFARSSLADVAKLLRRS